MSHQVESMMYVGETPWHGLGRKLDNPPTVEEAIKAAELDWTVHLEPIYAKLGTKAVETLIDGKKAVVRSGGKKRVLGVVGSNYTPLQNVDAFKFFDPYLESGNFQLETAGSLAEGRRVWILASLKDGVAEVVKDDPIKQYLLLSSSHDGSACVTARDTIIRVVCANTEAAAMAEAKAAGKLRHTRNIVARLGDLQEAMAERHAIFQSSLEQYRYLASKKVKGEADLIQFVNTVFQKKSERGTDAEVPEEITKGAAARAKVVELFSTGRGNQLPKVRGTWWAANNAVTEFIDHHYGEERGTTAERRLQHSMDVDSKRQHTLNTALKMAS